MAAFIVISNFHTKLLQLYEHGTDVLLHEAELPSNPLQIAVNTRRTRVAVACIEQGALIFDTDGLSLISTLPLYQAYTVAYSQDTDELLIGTEDGEVVFDGESVNGAPIIVKEHRGIVWNIAYSPSGDLAVSCGNDMLAIVWDVRAQTVRCKLQGHTSSTDCGVFISDQIVVTGGLDKSIRIWDATSGDMIRTIANAHTDRILTALYSPTHRMLITGGNDRMVRTWSPDGDEMGSFDFGSQVKVMYIDSNDELTVAGKDHTINTYEITSWTLLHAYPSRKSTVYGVVVSKPSMHACLLYSLAHSLHE